VQQDDLAIMQDAWQILEPPHAVEPYPNGIADVEGGICADFDHDKQGNPFLGYMRVGTDDLNILIIYWQQPDPNVPTDCQDY